MCLATDNVSVYTDNFRDFPFTGLRDIGANSQIVGVLGSKCIYTTLFCANDDGTMT